MSFRLENSVVLRIFEAYRKSIHEVISSPNSIANSIILSTTGQR